MLAAAAPGKIEARQFRVFPPMGLILGAVSGLMQAFG
jgi:hypothetical protein